MRATIVFDEENIINPVEDGLDDLLMMTAEVMDTERVSGTYFVTAQRAQLLRQRGRRDVLSALARHDLASHTGMASIHPTVAERIEHADWADGMARMAADELGAIVELEEIFGRKMSAYGRHGASYNPQLTAALGRLGLPFVYSMARLPRHNITWFCNTLNFAHTATYFQEAYLTRETFLKREQEFFELVKANADHDWVIIFQSHPCRLKTREYWDFNYYRGANPTPEEWRMPGFYPNFDFQTVKENWAFHCQRLRNSPEITLGTIADFAREFGQQAESAGPMELMALARRAAECDAPFWTDRFSAAEILDLLARWYLARHKGESVQELPRRNVLGPSMIPPAVPTIRKLEADALLRVARGITAAIEHTGMLPSRLRCGEGPIGTAGEIGTGTSLTALGVALSQANLTNPVPTRIVGPYLPEAVGIGDEVRQLLAGWPTHRPDLDSSSICRLTMLQTWTLKPAWPGTVPAFA